MNVHRLICRLMSTQAIIGKCEKYSLATFAEKPSSRTVFLSNHMELREIQRQKPGTDMAMACIEELGRRKLYAKTALVIKLAVKDPDLQMRELCRKIGIEMLEDYPADQIDRNSFYSIDMQEFLPSCYRNRSCDPIIDKLIQWVELVARLDAPVWYSTALALASLNDERGFKCLRGFAKQGYKEAALILNAYNDLEGIKLCVNKSFLYGDKKADEAVQGLIWAWRTSDKRGFDACMEVLKSQEKPDAIARILNKWMQGYFDGSLELLRSYNDMSLPEFEKMLRQRQYLR